MGAEAVPRPDSGSGWAIQGNYDQFVAETAKYRVRNIDIFTQNLEDIFIWWGNSAIKSSGYGGIINGSVNLGISFTILAVIGLVTFGLAVILFRKRNLPL
ncbi:hypothetical protein DFP94_10676 [Fontibacillus phaseoli]|uniref:Uncharacterized protein n=1 Tax=Fontibacillus phaseoli TaxID=1416533 RepID=A0A369BAJ3_9BACL|nr:hypothetical protein [Fontibacillus phaseoli]RCX18543.1 hypothetical protein DFP94_10676 [Fontibacillus phaseoli]